VPPPVPALTDVDFDSQVTQSAGLVLVDFWAPWCVPCEKVSPLVAGLAERHADQLRVRALDVDAHPAPAARHDVLSLPTLILFRDGLEVERLTGAPSERKLRKTMAKHLTAATESP
jgi:thioredoxin 1